jgi:hypothetical protein
VSTRLHVLLRARWLSFFCLLATLAPLWLGPMLLPIERAYAEAHHACACGMAMGTCGCPECERIEHDRREGASSPVPLLKGECEKGAKLAGTSTMPPALMPPPVGVPAADAVAELAAPPAPP